MNNKKTEVSVKTLQEKIRIKLLTVHDMSPTEWANSELPKQWGLKQAPDSLVIYLTSKKTVSMPVLQTCCEKLGIGTVKREVAVVRTNKYFITNS